MRWWLAYGLVAAMLAGCEEAPDRPDLSVWMQAKWVYTAATRADLGFTVDFEVEQLGQPCRKLPVSARLTIDGEEVALTRDEGGCVAIDVTLGPSLEWRDPITVRYEEGGQQVGEAVFARLMPGISASLAVPASGQVNAGGEIVIVPPPELPTSAPGYPYFYPLDESATASWPQDGIRPSEAAVRLPDGIHVKVPPLAGRVVLFVDGDPWLPEPSVTCDGFALCFGLGNERLGPIYLVVHP